MHTREIEPATVERMRSLLRKVRPVLAKQGWTGDQVAEVGQAIKVALEDKDKPAVEALRRWMEGKLLVPFHGVAVVPILSDAAEERLADLWWQRARKKSISDRGSFQ